MPTEASDATTSVWRTQVAPLRPAHLAVVYALLLVPPLVTFATDGSASLSYLLWAPAFVLSTVWGRARARRDDAPPWTARVGCVTSIFVGIAFGAASYLVATLFGDDALSLSNPFFGFALVALAAASEPLWRLHYLRSFDRAGRPRPERGR